MYGKPLSAWSNLSSRLKSAFTKAAGGLLPFMDRQKNADTAETAPPPKIVSTGRTFSEDLGHFVLPRAPVTPEALREAPPHFNNPDGKALIWAYIGTDDPTRGDSRSANGLAQDVARLMGGRMVYVDKTMLDKNFAFTSGIHESLQALVARDGAPDIVIGTHSYDVTSLRSCKPTMVISKINESIDQASRTRTGLVPHDLTPDILAAAGREFREKYPKLKGKLYTVMLSAFHGNTEHQAMRKLAHILAFEEDSTVYFCPNRRVHEDNYRKLVHTFYSELLSLGIADRVRLFTPTFEDMRRGYNPYRGLIVESDHVLQIGDSHSMVAESVCTGRPLYMTQDYSYYPELIKAGYVKDFMRDAEYPLPTRRLDPISVTTEVAGKLVDEFDRLARLRTIGAREEAHRLRRASTMGYDMGLRINADSPSARAVYSDAQPHKKIA